MWFPMPSARRLLQDVKLRAATEATLRATEKRLEVEKRRAEIVSQSQTATEKIASLWQKTAAQQAKTLEHKEAWWRTPYLWVAVGFAAGAAATIGLTFAINHSGAAQ